LGGKVFHGGFVGITGSGYNGSDPDKCLLLKTIRCNLGCFFLLGPAFWGQKQGFKVEPGWIQNRTSRHLKKPDLCQVWFFYGKGFGISADVLPAFIGPGIDGRIPS